MLKYGRFAVYIVILAIALNFYFRPSPQRPAAPSVTLEKPVTAPSTDIVLPDTQSLAVRREAIQGPFERSPFRLSFEFQSLSDGRSRMIGRSADGMTQLELVGPPEALTGALLKAQMPDENKLVQVRNLNALVNLARLAAPDWINAEAWVTDNIPTAFQAGRVMTAVEGRRVAMSAVANTKTLVLTITGPEF